MPRRTLVPTTFAVGLTLGCLLDLPPSTACHDTSDCRVDRVCVEGECADDPCARLCEVYCSRGSACDQAWAGPSCEQACYGAGATAGRLPAMTAGQCQARFDELVASDCPELPCWSYCADFCELAVECRLAGEVDPCFAGCLARQASCATTVQYSCSDLPTRDLACYLGTTSCE